MVWNFPSLVKSRSIALSRHVKIIVYINMNVDKSTVLYKFFDIFEKIGL